MRTLADWLGSAMKPLKEYGKESELFSRQRSFRHEKTHFRVEVGCVRLQKFLGVRLHHFQKGSRNRAEY